MQGEGMSINLNHIIDQVVKDKSIKRAVLVEALAAATGHPFEWFFGLEKPVPVILPPPETVVVQVLNVQASSHRRPAAS